MSLTQSQPEMQQLREDVLSDNTLTSSSTPSSESETTSIPQPQLPPPSYHSTAAPTSLFPSSAIEKQRTKELYLSLDRLESQNSSSSVYDQPPEYFVSKNHGTHQRCGFQKPGKARILACTVVWIVVIGLVVGVVVGVVVGRRNSDDSS